jgi:CheY-like chemotaxis protein
VPKFCEYAEAIDGWATVRVRDTGAGIPKEMLPRVFEMFAQVDRTLHRAQGGLGIGLSLVKRLVELHGGEIHASSEGEGKGSEFTVRLPLLLDESAEVQETTAEIAGPSFDAKRVLVVDDNKDAADTMKILLERMGHSVVVAYSGGDALEKGPDFRPQLALCDLGLPGMSGLEVVRRAKAHPVLRDAIGVAVTGWGQRQDTLASRATGFDHHVVKPLERTTLRNILAAIPD